MKAKLKVSEYYYPFYTHGARKLKFSGIIVLFTALLFSMFGCGGKGDDILHIIGTYTVPVLTDGKLINRTSNTAATIEFTTDEAGDAYYLVENAGGSKPANTDVKINGEPIGPVSVGVNINSVVLTVGSKDIYVIVEDADGKISNTLKIEAPDYIPGIFDDPDLEKIKDYWNGVTYEGGLGIPGYWTFYGDTMHYDDGLNANYEAEIFEYEIITRSTIPLSYTDKYGTVYDFSWYDFTAINDPGNAYTEGYLFIGKYTGTPNNIQYFSGDYAVEGDSFYGFIFFKDGDDNHIMAYWHGHGASPTPPDALSFERRP